MSYIYICIIIKDLNNKLPNLLQDQEVKLQFHLKFLKVNLESIILLNKKSKLSTNLFK